MPQTRFHCCHFHCFVPHHCVVWKLQCRFVSFAGTDANDALQFSDENFAVANFSGVSRFADDIDDFIQLIVGNRHIESSLLAES